MGIIYILKDTMGSYIKGYNVYLYIKGYTMGIYILKGI